jgi:hypothetical protein
VRHPIGTLRHPPDKTPIIDIEGNGTPLLSVPPAASFARCGAWQGVHHTAWKQEALGVSWEIRDKLTEATVKIRSAGSGSLQIAITYKN